MAVACLQSVEAFVEQMGQTQQQLQTLQALQEENRILKVRVERMKRDVEQGQQALERLTQQMDCLLYTSCKNGLDIL